jgi:hypothetical protein
MKDSKANPPPIFEYRSGGGFPSTFDILFSSSFFILLRSSFPSIFIFGSGFSGLG